MLILIFISFSLAACAGQQIVSAEVKHTVIPEAPSPGDPVTIAINIAATEALLFINDKQVTKAAFFPIPAERRQPTFMAAILTVPNTTEAKEAVIKIVNESGEICEISINITPKEFRTGTISITPSLSNLLTTPDPQRRIESERLWEILNTTGNKVYHTDKFVLPVKSTRRTSPFGARRINQYPDGRRTTEIHGGIDFGIPTGTEVYACGAGKVILSRHRIISGYSVIIEHAPGIYSLYYHLDSVIAEENAIIKAGELIGLSGSTGFSTGPHLHWELRINSEITDPDVFVNRPLIDKDLIIRRIFN